MLSYLAELLQLSRVTRCVRCIQPRGHCSVRLLCYSL